MKPKFNIDQKVFSIGITSYSVYVPCHTCSENGYITINCESFTCPKCHGQKKIYSGENKSEYKILNSGRVGKIETEIYSTQYRDRDRITYMLDTTGIGSGSIYDEKNLFESKELAQLECDKRNLYQLSVKETDW